MYAAEYGNSDLVKILLENAADINAQDNNGSYIIFCYTIFLPYKYYLNLSFNLFILL